MQPRFFLVIRNIKKFRLEKEGTFHLIYLTACARISTATSMMAYLIIVRGMRLLLCIAIAIGVANNGYDSFHLFSSLSLCLENSIFWMFVLSRCFKAIKILHLENISFCLVLHLL